ncbi:MAG: hypothetical protein J6B87_07375 [Clostridia bacterium]|nr:hypothetical protein [Clostridia bacterium]
MFLQHGIEKCRICEHYISEEQGCTKCDFEWAKSYTPCTENFDILSLNDDEEWAHLQVLDRLHYKKVDCLAADIWIDDNLCFLVGCNAQPDIISQALGINKECVYNDFEHCFVIINLFQEKYLRRMLDDENDC